MINTKPLEWSIQHTPAAGVKATITQAASAGVKHVCTAISVVLVGGAAVESGPVNVYLRDGASGAGTILWGATLRAPTANSVPISLTGLNIPGTAGNAMTLEFAAASPATTLESVALAGYDTT